MTAEAKIEGIVAPHERNDAIVVKNLSIEFPVLSPDQFSLRTRVLQLVSGSHPKLKSGMLIRPQALKNINLVAASGERIGLIGRNGAGKSTLLKVLAGVYPPVAGSVSVKGRVSALLGGNPGIDNDLSGWEAIDIGCMLFGLTRAEIRERKAAIAEFTELGDYLDMPLRTYSSGMRVRLAFAIATSMTPDVLLMDEVIGAGDLHFVAKAKARVTQMIGGAETVVIATHSAEILRQMCTRAMLIDRGEIIHDGAVDETLKEYRALK